MKVIITFPFFCDNLWKIEMGRSSADAEIRPNVRLGSARQRETIRPRQTFGVIGASNWRRFALTAGVNQSQYTYY